MIDNKFKQVFLNNVIKQKGCWAYNGSTNRDGYHNVIYQRDGERKHYLAHRIMAWIHGMDIEDKLVCHHCDNTSCVNPDHFFVGTNADNMADKVAKGRQSRGHIFSKQIKAGIAAKGGMKSCRGY